MIKQIFKFLIAKRAIKNFAFQASEITKADKILFAVFSRYGDGIISFRIISEFLAANPDKKYILLTTSQLVPYAKKLIKSQNIEILSVNKRNPFSLIPTVLKLKRFDADIGLNPWSHGDDAEFFISLAKRFYSYKKFSKHPKEYNVYDRVREYFGLDVMIDKTVNANFEWQSAKNIVIAPISTDPKKNLNTDEVNKIILKLSADNRKITVAVPKGAMNISGVNMFYFGKSNSKSNEFMGLLENADLFIGVDSGPMHLALCMGKECLGFFGSNAPETILDSGFSLISFRHPSLHGIFCFVAECKNPECIHGMFDKEFTDYIAGYSENMRLENNKCPLEEK